MVTATKKNPTQAVAGLMPPQSGEALIREAWPALYALAPGVVGLAKRLIYTVILAPVGWLLLAPLFMLRFAPFICRRYAVTNRRVMIQRGIKPKASQEIALAEIDDVRVVPGSVDSFYFTGDLEIVSRGEVKMKLAGVPEPEGFRWAILNAMAAWVPGKANVLSAFVPAKA